MVINKAIPVCAVIASLLIAGCQNGGNGGSGALAAPPPPPMQIVRVFWCIVDDGRTFPLPPPAIIGRQKSVLQNPGAPQQRFAAVLLARGLQRKNRIFAPAGLQFVSAGQVIIADPHPNLPPFAEGGELGDVVDPGDGLRRSDVDELPASPGSQVLPNGQPFLPPGAGRRQVGAVVAECLRRIGPVAPEMLVEIVIRRFVSAVDEDIDGRFDEDTANDGSDDDSIVGGIFGDGDGEDPIVQAPLLGLATVGSSIAIVVDPEAIPAPAVRPNLGRLDRFGQVLAHENGHALGLRHAAAPPLPRLMSATVPPWGQVALTPGEITTVQGGANRLSHTTEKDEYGVQALVDRPLSRVVVDALEDAPPAFDILSVQGTRELDGALTVTMRLNGLTPGSATEGAGFRFLLDVDGDAQTGVRDGPDRGYDLRADLAATGPQPRVTWQRYRDDGWQVLKDGRLAATLGEESYEGRGDPVPLFSTVTLNVPAESLPSPLAEGFRVVALTGSGNGEIVDRSPAVTGTITQFRPTTVLKAAPLAVADGGSVAVSGRGFAGNGDVAVFLGERLVATAATDAAGAFELALDVPPPDEQTDIRFSDGSTAIALLVIDSNGLAEICWLYRATEY